MYNCFFLFFLVNKKILQISEVTLLIAEKFRILPMKLKLWEVVLFFPLIDTQNPPNILSCSLLIVEKFRF